MKVLQLNTHASGGSYEYAALLSEALINEGIESRVLCKASPPVKGARVFFDRLIRRASVSFSREPWHGTRRLLPPPGLQELTEVDVVHLHTVADWFDVPRWLEALPERIGVVISLHDLWHVSGGCFLHRPDNRLVNNCRDCPILRWPASAFLASFELARKLRVYRKRRAKLVANSHWLAEVARQSPIVKACGRVRVIPPGIDTRVFKPQDKNLCRKQLGLPADAFVIVTGGASLTDANKNVPWLFEQLSHLPDLRGVIVLAFGEGTVSVPDGLNVRFTGGIRDRHDLAHLFAAGDIFVSGSLMESYGLTLVEAMACGTPVVAFRSGGIPESAPDEQAALLCESLDGSALLASIERLRISPQLRDELGSAASKLALTRNSKDQFAAEFVDVYRDCVRFTKMPLANTLAPTT
jgi:glycosyltransferase involved in cell wall biosynthesis